MDTDTHQVLLEELQNQILGLVVDRLRQRGQDVSVRFLDFCPVELYLQERLILEWQLRGDRFHGHLVSLIQGSSKAKTYELCDPQLVQRVAQHLLDWIDEPAYRVLDGN